jgi:hypothetical protein
MCISEKVDNVSEEDFIDFCGFEVPRTISKEAKAVLERIVCDGVVWVEHDDGPMFSAQDELREIADSLGMLFITDSRNDHCFVLFDPKAEKRLSFYGTLRI